MHRNFSSSTLINPGHRLRISFLFLCIQLPTIVEHAVKEHDDKYQHIVVAACFIAYHDEAVALHEQSNCQEKHVDVDELIVRHLPATTHEVHVFLLTHLLDFVVLDFKENWGVHII